MPGAGNSGRFQYTGQMWLPEAQLYHYRARAYAPQLGRFMQTDPIGYGDGANLYAYVGADPVNKVDPFGLQTTTLPDLPQIDWSCGGGMVRVISDGATYCADIGGLVGGGPSGPTFGGGGSIYDGLPGGGTSPEYKAPEGARDFLCNVGQAGKFMNDFGGLLELSGAGIAAAGAAAVGVMPYGPGEAAGSVLIPAGAALYAAGADLSVIGAFGIAASGDLRGGATALATTFIPTGLGRTSVQNWLRKMEGTLLQNGVNSMVPSGGMCPK